MTRRILSIGISATALCLPACLMVDGDLPPHLRPSGSPAIQPTDAPLKPTVLQATSLEPKVTIGVATPPFSAAMPNSVLTDGLKPAPTIPDQDPPRRPNLFPISQNPAEPKPAVDSKPADLIAAAVDVPSAQPVPPQDPPSVQGVLTQVPDWPKLRSIESEPIKTAPAATAEKPDIKNPGVRFGPIPNRSSGAEPIAQTPAPKEAVPVEPLPALPKNDPPIAVPNLPDVVSGGIPAPSALKIATRPEATAIPPAPAPEPPKLPPDSRLVKIVRAMEANDPATALKVMDEFEPGTRDLLSNLIQPVIRLSETGLRTLTPEEATILVERLTIVSDLVRSRAELTAGRIVPVKSVARFGFVIEDPRPAIQHGSFASIYIEVKNFTAEPVLLPAQPGAEAQRGYRVSLNGQWELHDAADRVVFTNHNLSSLSDLRSISEYQSQPKDYFIIYNIPAPPYLKPGSYTLWIQVTDVPTGRSFRRPIPFRIAGREHP